MLGPYTLRFRSQYRVAPLNFGARVSFRSWAQLSHTADGERFTGRHFLLPTVMADEKEARLAEQPQAKSAPSRVRMDQAKIPRMTATLAGAAVGNFPPRMSPLPAPPEETAEPEDGREGNDGAMPCNSGWRPIHKKKKKNK